MRLPIAIIGNGGAAAEAVLALRAGGYDGAIHLFADNDHAPYNPMLGPYLVSGRIPLEKAFPFGDSFVFYQVNGVDAHHNEPVTALDAEAQTLTTASGATHTYGRCLLAGGARPALPPVPGLREALAQPGSERRVFTLQTLDDALRLKDAVEAALQQKPPSGSDRPRPRAAVVGASFAGVKIADVLHDLGMQVTLVERETSILPLAAHPECARILEQHLLDRGYDLRLGAALSQITPSPDGVRLDFGALPGVSDPAKVSDTACTDTASSLPADLAVVCTGNRPALGFLTPGQVDTAVGVLIDEESRTNHPTLYAAGDVAQGKNLMNGRREVIGLWASARAQGRAAGRSMADIPGGYHGGVPNNITHVGDLLFAAIGCLQEYDHIDVSRREGSFRLHAWHEGRPVGVNLIDSCLDVGVLKQALLRTAAKSTAMLRTGVDIQATEATWTSFNA